MRAHARACVRGAGAELSNVAQEAVVLATRRDGELVELPDLVEAVQRTRFGVNGRRCAAAQRAIAHTCMHAHRAAGMPAHTGVGTA